MASALNHISARVLGLMAAFAGLVPATAHAQTIANVAQIEWDAGSSRIAKPSNRVELVVEQLPPPAPTLSTFQFATSGTGGQSLAVPTTRCHGTGGTTEVTIGGAFEGKPLSPATVRTASTIRAGEPLFVALQSSLDNRDGSAIETLLVTLETPGGEREQIELTESSANSATFVGMINTAPSRSTSAAGDCILSIKPGETFTLAGLRAADGTTIATSPVEVLIDPFGIVFDSGDGAPIPGSRVTLIDVATGQPAQVFGDDGRSSFPSTIVTGSTVTDSGGTVYQFPPGDYRFPFARAGTYRLQVEVPQPYTIPSNATPAELAGLLRPDGIPYTIFDASYGAPFVLDDPAPVRIDIPADRPGGAIAITKAASNPVAAPGDPLQYRITVRNSDLSRVTGAITVTDRLPSEMRLKKDSVRIDGVLQAYGITSDGRTLTISVPALRGGASATITYILEVRPDARPGQTLNRAQARDNRGTESAIADAAVRIERDAIADRMTIIGRITDGGCTVDPDAANGVPGVRVMLEDGSYAVTDIEGRYHFEGVLPGLHVVQIDPSTLPSGQVPADCARIARTGGSAISRFVEGQGGALIRADFRSTTGENTARLEGERVKRTTPPTDAEAAGANRNWFEGQTSETGWVFPGTGYNPRTKAIRVTIKHLPDQSVTLYANGKKVDDLALDGTLKNEIGSLAVTMWRAVGIEDGANPFKAEIRDANGQLVETLTRTVNYTNSAFNAELLRDKSLLVADGVSRPVIAVRMTDRNGRPVRHGLVGDFELPAPYSPAVEADAQAARSLAGLERAKPVWRVEGDDGIAYIELEPTTTSGGLSITLPFREGDVTRKQRLDMWLTPGNRPWTIVGFAAGTAGFNTLENRREKLGADGETWFTDARIALYAKGRVKGKWLMTLAYDSDKNEDETRFQGTIDPTAYYTIYADRSERRYDAASVRKLYLKLERPQFYALFGDYETGINEPQLARYSRAFNGIKAEYGSDNVRATAFVADTPFRHRRQEIQGNGLSGPYALAARDILPNSERVLIEVRDRLRSDRIVETRPLVRNIDYDIDYRAGTLRFREPILSRTSALDPQFIVIDYEVDGVGQRVTNAGGRATWTNYAKTLTIGATGIHNEDDAAKTNLGGADIRFTPNAQTEIRAEFAMSDAKPVAGSTATPAGSSTAWLIEAEHHSGKVDVLAYAREQQAGFGVGQNNAGESGTRKFGIDGRVRITPEFAIAGSGWQEDFLASDARRQAARGLIEYRGKGLDLRAGGTIATDRLDDGSTRQSTILQFGATKRLLKNRLELDAQTEIPLGGESDSVDFPARHKFAARYAINEDITLIGTYEIADGDSVDARTARIGFDLKPWTGARFTASANNQETNDYGPRTFASYGLAQSLPVGKKVTVDFTLEGNKTLAGGIDAAEVLNPLQPVASGGFIGIDNVLTEDFTAVTAGATYRGDRWSVTGRAEYRAGDLGDRYGITMAGLRQIGEGRAFGGALTWFRADQKGGPRTDAKALALSWAHRPDDSRFAFLEKLELREDSVKGAIFGAPGPIGGAPLTISGDATSKRIINSFSFNWSPTQKRDDGSYLGRSEVSGFWGSRYVFDRFGEDDLKGWSNVFGADIRFDLSETFDLGLAGTIRQNPGGRAYSYAGGPAVGISPVKNSYVSVGYNVVGFSDRDFEDSRYTRKGPFVTLRFKFDQGTLADLGLGRRR